MKYLIIIFIVVLFVSLFAIKSCNKKEKELNQTESNITIKNDSILVFVDKDSVKHFQKEVEISDLRSTLILNKLELEKTKEKLGISLKQIISLQKSKATINLESIGKTDTFYIDSNRGYIFKTIFKDKFNDCYVEMDSSNYFLQCSINVPLTITDFWKKKHKFLWFIRRRKIFTTDYSSENPNVIFTSIEKIKIQK